MLKRAIYFFRASQLNRIQLSATKRVHSLRPIHNYNPTVINKYWQDIMVYTHNPELFHLGKTELQDTQIRNFIESVIKSKRQDGDIWPVLLCKQLTEYYENTDNSGKLYFFNLLGKEFGLDHHSIQIAIDLYKESAVVCC